MPGAPQLRLSAAHFEAVRTAGFDTVRLPVRWSAHPDLQAPYTIDPSFFGRVDLAVEQALAHA